VRKLYRLQRTPSPDLKGSQWHRIDLLVLSVMLGLVGLYKHRPAPPSMDFMTERGIFKTRLARPDKGGLRGKLTGEELEKVLATYIKGRLSPGPDGIISELLKDATSTERSVVL
jgi:hypothetical protein